MAALRSLKATQDGINQIQTALTAKKLSREELAKLADKAALSTTKNFCTGKSVDRKYFVRFCELLDLEWELISGSAIAAQSKAPKANLINIDTLVQDLRVQVSEDIQKQCSTMRVLDMTQPIDANAIYTDVNILEKVTGKTRAEIEQLMQGCGSENFDRFFLGNVRYKRVDGLEAIDRHNLLMILGKPGSGKTTFLKRLAMLCSLGERFVDRVPIFVNLKEFADSPNKPKLLDFIGKAEAMQQVLSAERGFVLLDGLDEVQEAEHDRVLAEIRNFARRYDQNCIIITCRIAAREYIFERFTEVEVADFNHEQIEDFVMKWFRFKNPEQSTLFLEQLEMNEPVKELATIPLLLTLLCLEFEEASAFPVSRAELYQRGLTVLLSKWDGTRGIKRDTVYKKLSTKRKESLLGRLATHTFEQGNYFFKQVTAERLISQYIQNLPDVNTDPEALLVDSNAVLKSIEFQHGLLVERATGIYSFSHLTFHEYFVTKDLVEQPNQGKMVCQILNHIPDKRWNEIFLLLAEQLEPADLLFQSIKLFIDDSIKKDNKIQAYLGWLQTKSNSVAAVYKAASIRAFYFQIGRHIESNSNENNSYDFFFDLACAVDSQLDCDILSAYEKAELHNNSLMGSKNIGFIFTFGSGVNPDLLIDLSLAISLGMALDFNNESDEDLELRIPGIYAHLVRSESSANQIDLSDELIALNKQFIKLCGENFECSEQFWKTGRAEWTNQLCQAMIAHRNIGHKWQFTVEQQQKLQKYYMANQLLVDCLNSQCYVSRSVRKEIEETLFLPIAEIKKWKREH
jgi:predicted NACHT family NTPase